MVKPTIMRGYHCGKSVIGSLTNYLRGLVQYIFFPLDAKSKVSTNKLDLPAPVPAFNKYNLEESSVLNLVSNYSIIIFIGISYYSYAI